MFKELEKHEFFLKSTFLSEVQVSSTKYKFISLNFLPNPVNTSELFQEKSRNELGLRWIVFNIQARLSLDFQEILTSFFLQDDDTWWPDIEPEPFFFFLLLFFFFFTTTSLT